MKNPYFSIIIPAYNRSHFIAATLNSVKTQEFKDWECIIVDDGSQDNTRGIADAYAMGDSRFKSVVRPKSHLKGGNGARNYGASLAQTKYLIFLDSDDLIVESFLKKRYTLTQEKPDLDMYVFKTAVFYSQPGDSELLWNTFENSETLQELILRFSEQDMPWHTNGVVWKKEFFQEIGSWDKELRVWQDWELHIRALTYKPRLYCSMSKPDNYYRINSKESIASKHNSEEYLFNIYDAIKKAEDSMEDILKGNKYLKRRFKYLILRNLINYPMTHKMRSFPFKIIGKEGFENIRKHSFLWFTIIEFMFSRYRFRNLTGKIYYYRNLKMNSQHLKVSINKI